MTENLNLMTRRELTTTLGLMTEDSIGAAAISSLLLTAPHTKGVTNEQDLFEVLFEPEAIEDISCTVEQYSYAIAERYVAKMEEGAQRKSDDDEHFFWQGLHEKWAYLEIMGG